MLRGKLMIKNVDKYDLMELAGCTKTQAQRLMKQAKALMVADGFTWYAGKRISRVPVQAVERILGFKISVENDIMDDVRVHGAVVGKDNSDDSQQG